MVDKKTGDSPFLKPASVLKASNPVNIAKKAACALTLEPDGQTAINVPVLNGNVRVLHPSIEIQASEEVNTFVLKLLTVLYLSTTNGADPSGEWIPYRELPGARFYEPVFKRSVEIPLATEFGSDINGFNDACATLGGLRQEHGDIAYSFNLFPKVPLCFVLWVADEEFPANAQVLFDSNCYHHLNAFDLRMGAEEISRRLIRFHSAEE